MVDRRSNVAVLPRWEGAARRQTLQTLQTLRPDGMRAAVEQLDEVACRLEQVSPCLSWSAQRWMIASTPFRMWRIAARKRLDDLASISSASERNVFRWAFELDNACLEARRRLRELDVCLHTLQSAETSPAERVQATETFSYSRSMLLKVLRGGPVLNRFTLSDVSKMTPKEDSVDHATADQKSFREKLNEELREIDERLQSMLEMYQEKPSVIDRDVLEADNRARNVEVTVTDVYHIMRTRVYSDDCPLKAEIEIWEAFNEQKDEFVYFYRSALKAIESYKEVMRVNSLINSGGRRRSRRGDLERVRQDEHSRIAERFKCIDAVDEFRSKFSAMLTVLLPTRPFRR